MSKKTYNIGQIVTDLETIGIIVDIPSKYACGYLVKWANSDKIYLSSEDAIEVFVKKWREVCIEVHETEKAYERSK